TLRPALTFDSQNGERLLKSFYGVAALDAFGSFSRAELSAAGALAGYLDLTQKGKRPAPKPLRRSADSGLMAIDPATRRNLELTETLSGERRGSLLTIIDLTVTAAGARLLNRRLMGPLTDAQAIAYRLDAIGYFLARSDLKENIRDELKSAPDLARACGRIALGRGGPRDLVAIRAGVIAARQLRQRLGTLDEVLQPAPGELNGAVREIASALHEVSVLQERLERLLVEEPPFFARDGGFIQSGAHEALDEARSLRDESRRVIAEMEARYRSETQIPSLKIKHNAVLGYFIEVT